MSYKKTEKGGYRTHKPKSITNEQAAEIINVLPARQDKLIFQLAVESGLRISDILKLRVQNIRKNPLEIYESKSKRSRLITISGELHERLKAPHRFSFVFGYAHDFVFKGIRKPDKHYNRVTYHRHLKNVCKALKIDFSAHSTRKLYAQNIFSETKDIFEVQKALNHKYVTTTATYLDIDITKLLAEVVPK
jgi:integrase